MPDIFISYSHADSDWVKNRLLPELEQHNFTSFIDHKDFRSGASSVQEMERGVLETRRTLLVLTPEYLASEWCLFENLLAQTLDPAAVQRKVVPVLLKKCNMPLRLQMLHYRDLSGDDPSQWALLARDLI